MLQIRSRIIGYNELAAVGRGKRSGTCHFATCCIRWGARGGALTALALAILLAPVSHVRAAQLQELCVDRTAIEGVYYGHRTGIKEPFSQVLSAAAIEQLVRQDLHKEAVLQRVYHTVIKDSQVGAEIARMEKSTHSPEVLKELKQALGNDRQRIGRSLAKPLLVEKELRQAFADDQSLHHHQRERLQDLRNLLLKMKKEGENFSEISAAARKSGVGAFNELTWSLPAPSRQTSKTKGPVTAREDARPTKPNEQGIQQVHSFGNLPSRMQAVLKAQLLKPGDVTGVIELPTEFLICILKERTGEKMNVAMVTAAKRDFESWLREQPTEWLAQGRK
jgi:hypothetical protein